MRAWLDPDQLAAYNLTAADISTALAANNFLSAIGTTKGQMVQVTSPPRPISARSRSSRTSSSSSKAARSSG